jgi:hypothetical protein
MVTIKSRSGVVVGNVQFTRNICDDVRYSTFRVKILPMRICEDVDIKMGNGGTREGKP